MASASSWKSVEMVLKWREVANCSTPDAWSSSRKCSITDSGQPSWRYNQCRRWQRSQSLPWTDVGYTSMFVTEIFRHQVMQTAVDEDWQFVLDTPWYSQPVQVAKQWCYALKPQFREDQTASEMTYIVSGGALNSIHSLTHVQQRSRQTAACQTCSLVNRLT